MCAAILDNYSSSSPFMSQDFGFPDLAGLLLGGADSECSMSITSSMVDCTPTLPKSTLLLNQMLKLQQEFQDAVASEGALSPYPSLDSPFINFNNNEAPYPFDMSGTTSGMASSDAGSIATSSPSHPNSPQLALAGLGLVPLQEDIPAQAPVSEGGPSGPIRSGPPYTFGQTIKQELFQALPRSQLPPSFVRRQGPASVADFMGTPSPMVGSPFFEHGWSSLPGTPPLRGGTPGYGSNPLHSRNVSSSSTLSTISTPNSDCGSPYFQQVPRQTSSHGAVAGAPWSPLEDELLQASVDVYGCSDWSRVAVHISNRTPAQCADRWQNRLSSMVAKGKWLPNEDAILRQGVSQFLESLGDVSLNSLDAEGKPIQVAWNKIAQSIPGRSGVQCQARWSEALDPSVHKGKWSGEEDRALLEGMQQYDKSWIKIASVVPGRTQRQCRTRWMQISGLADRSNRAKKSLLRRTESGSSLSS